MQDVRGEDQEAAAAGDTVGTVTDVPKVHGQHRESSGDYAQGYRDGRQDAYASAIIFLALNPGTRSAEWLERFKVAITQGHYLDEYDRQEQECPS